jgi:hypothetical protein
LKDFLKENASEVVNMLLTEWKLEDALVVEREEGREETTRNALAKGFSVDIVSEITGLGVDTITRLSHKRAETLL